MTETATATPFSPARELREAFWRLKRSRIRISPAPTSRASSIGDPCERRLFYDRTATEQAIPYEPSLQAIFDLGRGLQPFVERELEDMGCELVQRECGFLDRERQLSARFDVKLVMRGWQRPLPCELKGLNPYSAESIEKIEDIRDSLQPWIRKYYDQLQTYIHFDGSPAGVFILLNKSTGQITFIDCPRDQERIDAILAKAERIRDAVRTNAPPARVISDECARCPHRLTCLPDHLAGAGAGVLEGPIASEAAELIARRIELAEAKSEFDGIDRRLKKLLPEKDGELLVGDFAVTGKWIERAGYEVKASKYLQRSYVPLVKAK